LVSQTAVRKWAESVREKDLRKMLRPKTDELRGKWRRLHNEELYDLYSSPNQIKKNETRRACGTYGDKRCAYRVLMGKPDGERPLAR
jgi:hypothetical protein